jgi:hypothetical protein
VQGNLGRSEITIGSGNVGNLIGDAIMAYPSSSGDIDIATNGFTLQLDGGNGNAFAYSGSLSGSGNVEFTWAPRRLDTLTLRCH